MNTQILMQKLVFVASVASQAVLYILVALSILSIGVIVERWWYFFRRRDDLEALAEGLRAALDREDVAGARKLLASSRSVEAAIVGEAMTWYDRGPEAVEQIIPKATRLRRKSFEAGLLFLGTLGNNAPFIGLFGTVLGIVTAFRELGNNSMGAMGNVMSGIAEALISTAVGILVALPAVIYYNIFQKKGGDIEEQAAALGNVVLASMRGEREAAPKAADPLADRTAEHVGRVAEVEA